MASRELATSVAAAGVVCVAACSSLLACGVRPYVPCDGGDDVELGSNNGWGSDSGGVVVLNPTFTNVVCPSINPVGVGPENGGVATVDTSFNSALNDAAVSVLTWTSTAGSFVDPHALTTTFRCAQPGVVIVTATLVTPGCSQNATSTASVGCSAAAAP